MFQDQNRAAFNVTIREAYEDFLLSRQAMMVTDKTIRFYVHTLGKFIEWLELKGVRSPIWISNREVRTYLGEMAVGHKTNYVNSHARTIKTYLIFCLNEGYIPQMIKFKMPPTSKERMLCYTASEVKKIIDACENERDRAIILLMVDTGLRRSEFCSLNWEDVDFSTGIINVKLGKGGKSRVVVMGARTRRALLAYRRTLEVKDSALFQTRLGGRFSVNGFRSFMRRIGEKTNLHITPHALRRTFATLALRAGMNPLHLQGLLGHATLEMTRRYVQMVDEDLQAAHKSFGPVDNLGEHK